MSPQRQDDFSQRLEEVNCQEHFRADNNIWPDAHNGGGKDTERDCGQDECEADFGCRREVDFTLLK